VFVAVDEAIDTFLMQVESFVFVRQLVNVVNVDQSIKRARENIVKVRIELYFGYPALVSPLTLRVNAIHSFLSLQGLHFLSHLNFSLFCLCDLHVVVVIFVTLLVASGLLFFSDGLITGLSSGFFTLKSLI
jgi:hypothetical protein